MKNRMLTRTYRRPSRAAAILAADDAARELLDEGWVEASRFDRAASDLWSRIVAATGRPVATWELLVIYRRATV
jgi:predicted cobalt transporter CbtA